MTKLEKTRASEDRKIPNTLPTGSGCDLRHQISRCSPPEPSADIKTTFLDQNICPSLRVFFFGLLALVSSLVLNSMDQSWISFHSHNTRSRQPATRETSHGSITQSPVHLWKNESGKFCLNLLSLFAFLILLEGEAQKLQLLWCERGEPLLQLPMLQLLQAVA
jgi:hypothetical protein